MISGGRGEECDKKRGEKRDAAKRNVEKSEKVLRKLCKKKGEILDGGGRGEVKRRMWKRRTRRRMWERGRVGGGNRRTKERKEREMNVWKGKEGECEKNQRKRR